MVLTGPVKPEATEAVTCTGEVTVALLSGVEMTTPPVPVREAVRSLGAACLCWRKATAPAARTKRTPRTIYWIKPRWERKTRAELIGEYAQIRPCLPCRNGRVLPERISSGKND